MLTALTFLTWRESVVGMKPTEMVQMDLRRTWDIRPKSSPDRGGGSFETSGGGVNSETFGFVRWRMKDVALFGKPTRQLVSECYDKKQAVLLSEEVWTNADGEIVRQYEERKSEGAKETSDAAFYKDHIEITRTNKQGKSTFAEMNPAGGMEEAQRRFKPMEGDRKEFLQLDGLAGAFHKVKIERTGRFRGSWSGKGYDGPAFRFTLDGVEQTLMMTPEDEIVQVGFDKEIALVLAGTPKSHRKPGLGGLLVRRETKVLR